MKALVVSLLLLAMVTASAAAPVFSGEVAQKAHAAGSCGSLGLGAPAFARATAVVSMLPGNHEFRVRSGTAHLTVARMTTLEFDVGRPNYIVLEGLRPGNVMGWKVPGKSWEPIAKDFLYPA